MYRLCWNTLFFSKPKSPHLRRGGVGEVGVAHSGVDLNINPAYVCIHYVFVSIDVVILIRDSYY